MIIVIRSDQIIDDQAQCLHKDCNIEIGYERFDKLLYLNAVINAVTYQGVADGYHNYKIELGSWLELLEQNTNTRLFINKSSRDIIRRILDAAPYNSIIDESMHDFGAVGGKIWEMKVQYNETDLNFLNRMLDECGVLIKWEHDDSSAKLNAYESIEELAASSEVIKLNYEPSDYYKDDINCAYRFNRSDKFCASKYLTSDYNEEDASLNLLRQVDKNRGDDSGFSSYQYPGGYSDLPEGEIKLRKIAEKSLSRSKTYSGLTKNAFIRPGNLIEIEGHADDGLNGEFVVIESETLISALTGESVEQNYDVEVHFVAVHVDNPFRPDYRFNKPCIHGLQTAVVSGPAGEELHVDGMGRVKVKFHWDLDSDNESSSSCWVRVATPIAGNGWGHMFIPRIGQEVVVAFLEGNPDRPIILNSVYNSTHRLPYRPDQKKYVSTIKTKSSESNEPPEDYNELRFDDTLGSEEIYLRAQKDKKIEVINNGYEDVGKNYFIKVGDKLTISVGSCELIMSSDGKIIIKGEKLDVKMNQQISLQGGTEVVVKGGKILLN